MILKKPITILCMDDDADDLQLLQEVILSIDSSYRIVTAVNGEEGLQKLQWLKQSDDLPGLIVLDINMPKLNGRETFLRIKEDPLVSSIPLVVMSTSCSPKDRLFFGAADISYITKPVNYSSFLEVATELLSRVNKKTLVEEKPFV